LSVMRSLLEGATVLLRLTASIGELLVVAEVKSPGVGAALKGRDRKIQITTKIKNKK